MKVCASQAPGGSCHPVALGFDIGCLRPHSITNQADVSRRSLTFSVALRHFWQQKVGLYATIESGVAECSHTSSYVIHRGRYAVSLCCLEDTSIMVLLWRFFLRCCNHKLRPFPLSCCLAGNVCPGTTSVTLAVSGMKPESSPLTLVSARVRRCGVWERNLNHGRFLCDIKA